MIATRDTDWLAEHGLELCEKYPNKWVAVHDRRVIAAGDTLAEAAEQALKLRPQRDFILEQINLDVDLPSNFGLRTHQWDLSPDCGLLATARTTW